MNELSFAIMRLIIGVCVAVITVYVAPYIRVLSDNEKYAWIFEIADEAVRMAEQTIRGSGRGAEKKNEAEARIVEWALKIGLDLTAEQIDQLIESAVYDLNREKKNG